MAKCGVKLVPDFLLEMVYPWQGFDPSGMDVEFNMFLARGFGTKHRSMAVRTCTQHLHKCVCVFFTCKGGGMTLSPSSEQPCTCPTWNVSRNTSVPLTLVELERAASGPRENK